MSRSHSFATSLLALVLGAAPGCGTTPGGETTSGTTGPRATTTAGGTAAAGGTTAASPTTGGSTGGGTTGSKSSTGGGTSGTTGGATGEATGGTSGGTSGTTTGAAPASLSIAINSAPIEGSGCFPPAEFSVCSAGYGYHTICKFTVTNVGSLATGALAYAFSQGLDGGFGVEFDGCTGMTLGPAAQCFMQLTSWTESTPVGHTGSLTMLDKTDPSDDAGVELTITNAADAGCF